MKAFVFSEKGHIELRELPAPVLEQNKAAILKPRFLSPCSSDVHTVYAGPGPRRDNLILGHEGIAEVVEVGSGVRDFQPGDLVAVSAVMPDEPGGHGHEGAHFSGTKLGRNIDGMWAERFKVPDADRQLVLLRRGAASENTGYPAAEGISENALTAGAQRLKSENARSAGTPDLKYGKIPMEAALMAVDMMATGFTAAEKAEIRPGDSVLVIGSGAVGLMAIAAAKAMGAGSIYCIGTPRNEAAVRLAREYGAEVYISYRDGSLIFTENEEPARDNAEGQQGSTEGLAAAIQGRPGNTARDPRANATGHPAIDTVLDLTREEGVDRVLICGGDASSLIWASDVVKYGTGRVVNVAYLEGSGMVELPIFSLGRGMAGKTFCFTLSNGGRDWTEKMLDFILEDAVDPAPLVTHQLTGFESIPKALEMMRDRPAGMIKIMVDVRDVR